MFFNLKHRHPFIQQSLAIPLALSLTLSVTFGVAISPLSAVAHTNTSRSKPSSQNKQQPQAPGDYQLVEVLDGIHHYLLTSGQHVYVKSLMDQPIITLDTWVNTGSVNETKNSNGVSHFLEHLLFKGTNTTKVGDIDRKLEGMGGVFNAATSLDYTHYYIKVPATAFPKALNLHANMMVNASLPADAIERERAVVKEEINRSMDSPQQRLVRNLTATLFNGHGYAYDTLGSKTLIDSVPRKTIVDYYRTWYQPKHFHTVVTGQIKPERAVALVAEAFNNEWTTERDAHPDGDYQPPNWTALSKPAKPVISVTTDPNVTQTYMILGFLGPKAADKEETFALDTALLALGQGRSSRLNQQIKEDKKLVQSISAGNWTQHHAGLAYISADLPSDIQPETAIDAILNTTRHTATYGLSNDELMKAKQQTRESFIFLNESTTGLAQNIGYNVTIANLKDFTSYVNGIEGVNQQDAQTALINTLNPQHAVVVAVAPEGTNTKKLTKTIENSLNKAIDNWPSPEAVNSSIQNETQAHSDSYIKRTLDNGLTFINKVRPNSNTVALKLMIQGGKRTETKPGTAQLLAKLMTDGTKLRSQAELAKTMDENGLHINVGAGQDAITVSASVLKENLGETLWLLRDILLHPTLSDEDLNTAKTQLMRGIQASQEVPSSLALQELQQAIYPNHPYGNTGQRLLESIPTITRKDILDYYHHHMMPNNMILAVSGDFDPYNIGNILTDALPAGINASDTSQSQAIDKSVAPLDESTTLRNTKSKQAATAISRGWLVPPIPKADELFAEDGTFSAAAKQYGSIKLINTILGTGLSSRLFVNLREKQGLGYVASSMAPSAQQASRFIIYMGTDPNNEQKVLAGFEHEIEQLMTTPLTDEELANGKQKLIGNFALAHESNTDHAYYLAAYESMGAGYAFDGLFPRLIERLTAEDIQQAAKAIFSKPSVTSIVSPQAAGK